MSARSKLRQALDSIDDAKRRLKRARNDLGAGEAYDQIRRAIRELEDAETDIQRAISDVND
jgi:hypothetical protein